MLGSSHLDLPLQLFFPVFFVGTWFSVLFILSRMGGWTELSEKYRCDEPRVSSWRCVQFAKFGLVSYKRCLWIAAASDGMYLKTGPLFLFRAFHPPLRIPWSAIKGVEEQKYWWMDVCEIQVNNPPVRIVLERSALSESERFLPVNIKRLESKAPSQS